MKKLISIFLFILFIQVNFANYYADIEIFVDEKGETTITGTSNYLLLNQIEFSPHYTSKKGEFWVFNLSIQEPFDNFIYELNLPKGSEVNYVRTTPNLRFSEENNAIKLIGTGESRELNILVQYKINKSNSFDVNIFLIYFIIFVSILILSLRLFGFKFRKSREVNKKKEIKKEINVNLPQRQIDIINILKEKKKVTQKELEEIMKIPKSSISRNIRTLEIKGYIKKETIGVTNYISLKE